MDKMQITVQASSTGTGRNSYYIEFIELTGYGLVRIVGWAEHSIDIKLVLKTGHINPLYIYRRNRPDVANYLKVDDAFLGFMAEFEINILSQLEAIWCDGKVTMLNNDLMSSIGYRHIEFGYLFKCDKVLHRGDLYGEGPPKLSAHPEIAAFADRLEGPILDFGCGNGFMVDRWTKRGIVAKGVEIDRPAIREHLLESVSDFVTLYDGSLPLPFEDGEFETVFSSEVIEHVPNYIETIAEIARICRTNFAITVPDMTCIPIGSANWVVPWHMLEATHVNFFTRASLEATLKIHFTDLEFFNLGAGTVNDGYMPGSLGCLAKKIIKGDVTG